MKILVIGGGAREHTLVWKLAHSPKVGEIYVAPGNAGTAQIGHNLAISPTDVVALLEAIVDNRIDFVVVGPDAPLAAGIVDSCQQAGIPVFGPTRSAAEIEWSKAFAKHFMQKNKIPCARSVTFTSYAEAREYLQRQTPPVVVKADGLAAGKGVVVAQSLAEALAALADYMEKRTLGDAGSAVIIEECLAGREVSTFAFCDGNTVVPMIAACDYKRAFDGGHGPNTGGMGAYAPPPFYTPALAEEVVQTIMRPVVQALAREGRPYKGVLYGGLMVTAEGPKVLEFNARFGDPETQVVLPMLKTDLVEVMLAVMEGRLDRMNVEWHTGACVGVVLASGGYPGKYKTDLPISGLETVDREVFVFHAGTKTSPNGHVLTNGGRVLTLVSTGRTIAEAREKVYNNMSRVRFEGSHYRHDIALVPEK